MKAKTKKILIGGLAIGAVVFLANQTKNTSKKVLTNFVSYVKNVEKSNKYSIARIQSTINYLKANTNVNPEAQKYISETGFNASAVFADAVKFGLIDESGSILI
jgi:hypothetical protein